MKAWHVVVVVAALAAGYYFIIYRRRQVILPGVGKGKGPSKKSKWRRALAQGIKVASIAGVPGAGQIGAIGIV